MNSINKAQIIVQAQKAWYEPPEKNDPLVKKVLKMERKDFEKKYEWAKQVLSAMRWNTLTLGIR